MSQAAKGDNLQWFGFLSTLVCLALLVLMALAMFTTQRDYPNRKGDSYGPVQQMQQFQENVGKALDRAFGEVL